jgi:hypothetical protein
MQTYNNFAPSGFDPKGLGLEDRQDWLVAPCAVNRDSDILSEVNWEVQEREISAAGEDFEIHRFGHWACGWFEIMIVKPNSDCANVAEELEECLENYPILDENEFCDRERKAHEEGNCDYPCPYCE